MNETNETEAAAETPPLGLEAAYQFIEQSVAAHMEFKDFDGPLLEPSDLGELIVAEALKRDSWIERDPTDGSATFHIRMTVGLIFELPGMPPIQAP